jgi:hypothetical protein
VLGALKIVRAGVSVPEGPFITVEILIGSHWIRVVR